MLFNPVILLAYGFVGWVVRLGSLINMVFVFLDKMFGQNDISGLQGFGVDWIFFFAHFGHSRHP